MENVSLARQLQRSAAYTAQYRGTLSNHLPMALVALVRMGADQGQVDAFFATYARRLQLKRAPRADAIGVSDWKKFLGQHSHHEEYVQFFTREQARLGKERLLASYVPELIPGVAGAAFHGLIRLAYGLDAESDAEICEGLAHWADSYLELVDAARFGVARTAQEPRELLAAMAADPYWDPARYEIPTIYAKMAKVAADPHFEAVLQPLPASEGALRQLALLALDTYAATSDFTALHLVTSAHALRIVAPYCGDLSRALQHYWLAFKAAYVTIGCPSVTELPRASALPSWNAIRAAAVRSTDDHTIKLVYTCACEEAAYDEPKYRQIAAGRTAQGFVAPA